MRISRSGEYIGQIKHVGGRVFERLLLESGIDAFNGPQGKILDVLWQEDGLSAREIGQRSGLAGSTLTSMLDRMEAAGLVERRRSTEDRRSIRVCLTERAQGLQAEYETVSERMTEIYFRGFDPREIDAFEESLRRVLENVKAALATDKSARRDPGANEKGTNTEGSGNT